MAILSDLVKLCQNEIVFMFLHSTLGKDDAERSRVFRKLVHAGEIAIAGNARLKIYGTLQCTSGKRMKTGNRVFFKSITEAKKAGYRPCGHCMREKYAAWSLDCPGISAK